MLPKKINKLSKEKTVLVVPLDWGLGHATRCIPLIKELQLCGCTVIIAAENNVRTLLEREFQQLTFITVPGYRVSYSRSRHWLPLKIFLQIPKIIYRVYKEHSWLKKVAKRHDLDGIVSDNRFGLFHSSIPCIYITHQLLIKTGSAFTESLAQKLHYKFIKKYTACWVPDFAGKENMAGELSHPHRLPGNVSYIGGLSRFDPLQSPAQKQLLLIILSGPEPQRSVFEDIILKNLKNYKDPAILIRGLPGATSSRSLNLPKNIVVEDHLPAVELNKVIVQANYVIARSGYTTVMDLLKLGRKAILVPTPGQTEQEYLAEYLMGKKVFFSVKQEHFHLEKALERVRSFPFASTSFDMDLYKQFIHQFVELL